MVMATITMAMVIMMTKRNVSRLNYFSFSMDDSKAQHSFKTNSILLLREPLMSIVL